MAESAVAEAVTAAPSEVSTPVSTDAPELVSTEETAAPASQGAETPVTGEAPKPPESYTRAELDEMYGSGKLIDPTLVSRRESLIQSENDRKAFESRELAARQAREQAAIQERRTASTRYKADVDAINAQFEEYGGPPQLLENLLAQRAALYEAEVARSVESEHRIGHRDAIMRLEGEVSLKRRDELDAMSLPDLAAELFSVSYKKGQLSGAPEGYEMKKVADWTKEKEDYAQKLLDDYKAANPLAASTSTAGWATTIGAKTYGQMTAEERATLTPEQRDALIAAQYRR